MNKLDFNIGISLFVAGALLFLAAPSAMFGSYAEDDLALAGLFIESIGVVTVLIVHFRDKNDGLCLD